MDVAAAKHEHAVAVVDVDIAADDSVTGEGEGVVFVGIGDESIGRHDGVVQSRQESHRGVEAAPVGSDEHDLGGVGCLVDGASDARCGLALEDAVDVPCAFTRVHAEVVGGEVEFGSH